MSFYSEGRSVVDSESGKVVAISVFSEGAEVIAKALEYFFNKDTFTENKTVEMMNINTSDSFKLVADFCEKNKFTSQMIIEYLREISDEMAAQALVVSIRDELKFGKPNENTP